MLLKLRFIFVIRSCFMEQPRILILTNRVPYPLNDGGALAMDALINGYHQEGWKVFLLSINASRQHVTEDKLKKIYTNLHGFEVVNVDSHVKPVGVIHNFLFSKEPNHAVRFYSREFLDKLKEVIQSFRPDVIQLESIYLSRYLRDIQGLTTAIKVLRLHNIEYQVWQRLARQTKDPVKNFYLKNLAKRIKRFEAQAWQDADLLLPITTDDADLVHQTCPLAQRITIPFGINTGEVKATNAEQWVGYHLGAMDWLPNTEAINWFLQQVWPRINAAVPDFRFYYAGRNMTERTKALGGNGAICAGEVEDAHQFISDKKILIVPLRSGGGIRVKILEAMAQGKVVISTGIGMQGIEANAGEHFLQADTPGDFAKVVKWCMDNKADAEQLGRNAQKLIKEQYDQHHIMQRLIKALELLINTRKP